MKKLLVLALVLIAKLTFAQKDTVGLHTPYTNGEVSYQKSYNTSGVSKARLFSNSQLWFMNRYKSLDSVQIQDNVLYRVAGRGRELVTFKGPLGMAIPCKVLLSIQIDDKDAGYRIRINNIVLGYQEQDNQPRTYFTAENMMDKLISKKSSLMNPVPFTKKQTRKALESLNKLVADVMASINQTMKDSGSN